MSPLPRICIQAYADKQPALECINPPGWGVGGGGSTEGTPARCLQTTRLFAFTDAYCLFPFLLRPPPTPRVRKAGNTRPRLLPLREIERVHSRVPRILYRGLLKTFDALIFIFMRFCSSRPRSPMGDIERFLRRQKST